MLFGSSYVPLLVIFAIRFPAYSWIWWTAAGVFLAATLGLLELVRRRVAPRVFLVVEVKDGAGGVAAYVASYILPFTTINEPSGRDLIAYGVLLLVLGVMYTRSGMIGVNPLLYLTRWRLYDTTTRDGESLLIIAKEPPQAGSEVAAAPVLPGLVIKD